jgi:hypothetical protein
MSSLNYINEDVLSDQNAVELNMNLLLEKLKQQSIIEFNDTSLIIDELINFLIRYLQKPINNEKINNLFKIFIDDNKHNLNVSDELINILLNEIESIVNDNIFDYTLTYTITSDTNSELDNNSINKKKLSMIQIIKKMFICF